MTLRECDHDGAVQTFTYEGAMADGTVSVGVLDQETGQMLMTFDYAAYGQRTERARNADEELIEGVTARRAFTGKESQKEDFDIDYIDFGARLYSPVIRRWVTPDPKSEDYYGISPYAYCADDPVNLVDPDGRDLKDKIYGILIGVLTNTITGSGAIRDTYTPTDAEDYNKFLKRTDHAFGALGTALVAVGGGMTTYGGIMATQGTVVAIGTAGVLSEVGVPVAVAGEGVVVAGAASSAVGIILQANSTSNQTSGYNRGGSSSDTQYKSINQLQQEVKKGITPKGIVRFDKSHGYQGQDHVHFKNGSALNRDGTWKDGKGYKLTTEQIKYLKENGWNIDN